MGTYKVQSNGKAQSDHKRGGITFESAKANNFVSSDEESKDSPAI